MRRITVAAAAPIALAAVCACGGHNVDLGHSAPGGATPGSGGTSGSGSSADPNGPFAATCDYSGPYSDGSGLLSNGSPPSSCANLAGAASSFASTSEVASALVGSWVTCGQSLLATVLVAPSTATGVAGIELTGDGHYFLLSNVAGGGSLERTTSIDGGGEAPGGTGTFEVVDASTSLGAGQYQVRFAASNGEVYLAQVTVMDSPRAVRFFAPSEDDYVPALTRAYLANVCGPPLGPKHVLTDAADVAARIQGRWANCPPYVGGSQGWEFPGDGTWFELVVDESGQLVRTDKVPYHGTLSIVPATEGLEPFTLVLQIEDPSTSWAPWWSQPIVDECRRGLKIVAVDSPSVKNPSPDPGSLFLRVP
jgi:hypothetical protein